MSARSLRIIAVVAIGLVTALGTSAAAVRAPTWQLVPTATADNGDPLWVAGRLWFLKEDVPGYPLRSAPVRQGRLGAWTSAAPRLGAKSWQYQGLIGDELVFASSPDVNASLYAIRMLPSGQLGVPAALAGAPPPQSSAGSRVIQLPDRAVRLVGIYKGNGMVPDPGACCDANGQAVDYVSLTGFRTLDQLGLDRHGRLWLAWGPFQQANKPPANIVELDPQTLKPRSAPATVPGLGSGLATIAGLVCSDVCRLVVDGGSLRRVSWAPGDASAAPIHLPTKQPCPGYCASMVSARLVAGHLVVAYWGNNTELGFTVGLARGDARGRNLRLVSSIQEPSRLGAFERGVILNSIPGYGVLTPDGFAAAAVYAGGTGSAYKAYLRVAILPLRP